MRISVWILGDQLLANHPALLAAEQLVPRASLRVIMVESASRLVRMPYQRKKLVLLLSAMRHYADELRAQGYTVDYVQAESAVAGLRGHVGDWQPTLVLTMAAAEFKGRRLQQERLAGLLGTEVQTLPDTQFLVGHYDPAPNPAKKVILETFYRAMRRHFGLLLDETGAPVGGAWNFDKENRRPLPKRGLVIPPPLAFAPDPTTSAVMAQVRPLEPARGQVDGFALAVTRAAGGSGVGGFHRPSAAQLRRV